MRNTKVKIAKNLDFGDIDAVSNSKITENFKCYMSPQWEDSIDSLNYLCQHKQVLMALIGVSGSGKTTFVQQFIAQASDALQICAIEAQQGLDTDELLTLIAADFKLSLNNKSEVITENLEEMLLSLQKQQQHFLLVIDNAHCLSNANLHALCYLATHQPAAHLHVLLVGDLPLQTRLENLDIAGARAQILQLPSLNLEETEQYLQHYLASEEGYNSSDVSLALSTAEIARLNRLSGGVPGRINRLAMRLLQKTQLETAKQTEPARVKSKKSVTLLGTGVLLMGFAAMAVWFSQQHMANHNNQSHQPHSVSTSTNQSPVNNNLPTIASGSSIAGASVYTSADDFSKTTARDGGSIQYAEMGGYASTTGETTGQPPAMSSAGLSEPASTTTATVTGTESTAIITGAAITNPAINTANQGLGFSDNSPLILLSTIATPVPQINTGIISSLPLGSFAANALWLNTAPMASIPSPMSINSGNNPTGSQLTTPEVIQSSNSITTTKPPSSTANTIANSSSANQAVNTKKLTVKGKHSQVAPLTLSGHTQSLLAAQPTHFSLQIMGSYNLNSITNLMKNSGLGKQAHYFRTLHQGKAWYVLVYGNYPSRQAAEQATAKLPQAIRSLNPWPRDFASIQSAIHAKPIVNATT